MTYNERLVSAIFEYIADNGISTIDEIKNTLTISEESTINAIELLIKFGLLEYNDKYGLSVMLTKTARIILD
jgi:predicted transcriptional regulator